MQDRYAGDIGDFAKFALLRALLRCTPLRLGVVWYLTRQSGDPEGDGRHIKYLESTKKNRSLYRDCDTELYEYLTRVAVGIRSVRMFATLPILPTDTVYYDRLLEFKTEKGSPLSLSLMDRRTLRAAWARDALSETSGCHVVMFDPDNGLEVKSTRSFGIRGPKYVFFEELKPYLDRGQSVIVYQHATRQGSMADQVSRRLNELQASLPSAVDQFAFIWRSVSTRAFFVLSAPKHRDELRDRSRLVTSGPPGKHFELLG